MRNKKNPNREHDDLNRQQEHNMSEDEQVDDQSVLRGEEDYDDESMDDTERFHNPNVDKSRGMKERERDNIE